MFDKLIEKIGFQSINELVGVDIGTASIKICVLEKTKKGLKLSHLAKKTYTENLLSDGHIIDNDLVAHELKNLLIENKIKGKYAACALSSYCVITKKVTMPLLEEKASERSVKVSSSESLITKKSSLPLFEDEKIIEAEVENIIPFPLKEINYSYQMMGLGDENENTINVIIVAAKKEIVDGFVNTFQAAGLNLIILDVDIFALTNIAEQIDNPEDSSVVVVDIGASVTNMAIIKGENIGFTREILLGGRYLTNQIEKSLKLTFEDAEQKKIKGDDDVLYLFEDFIFNIASEINKTINFYTSTNPNETLGKIYLSGGTSLLHGLKEKIAEYTNIEVEYLNPFAMLSGSPQFFNEDLSQFDIYEDYKEFNAIALQLSSRILELE
ncbi:MAG: type IV pilus assembly protein PilM [Candidatus Omnitrophica bacterium]|nr:type IV pilus assembly protein PilM [Candidatus Omnitrophota bacterium]